MSRSVRCFEAVQCTVKSTRSVGDDVEVNGSVTSVHTVRRPADVTLPWRRCLVEMMLRLMMKKITV